MTRSIFTLVFLCCVSFGAFAQYDDIYFNPKTDLKKHVAASPKTTSSYITVEDDDISSLFLDDNISLTEVDYTYSDRLERFHNENLLVHIEGDDTIIYDLENGRYIVGVEDNDIEITPYNESSNQSWSNVLAFFDYNSFNSYNDFNDFWYPFNRYSYSYWGNSGYCGCWNCGCYDYWYRHRPCYYGNYHHNYLYPYIEPYHHHHHSGSSVSNNYSYASNENYRLQHNSAGRYSGSRTSTSNSSESKSASNDAQRSVIQGSRSATVVHANVNEQSTGTRQVVRVANDGQQYGTRQSSSNSSTQQSGGSRQTVHVSSSSNSTSGTRSQTTRVTNSNTTTRSTSSSSSSSQSSSNNGSRSGSYSSGSRGGNSSSGGYSGGSRGGGSSSSGGGSRGSATSAGGSRR